MPTQDEQHKPVEFPGYGARVRLCIAVRIEPNDCNPEDGWSHGSWASSETLRHVGYVPAADLAAALEELERLRALAVELSEDGESHWRLKAHVVLGTVKDSPETSHRPFAHAKVSKKRFVNGTKLC